MHSERTIEQAVELTRSCGEDESSGLGVKSKTSDAVTAVRKVFSVKFGLLVPQSTEYRQNQNLQCRLVMLGHLGPG